MPGSFHFFAWTLASSRTLKKQVRRKKGRLKEEDSKVEDSVTSNWLMKPHKNPSHRCSFALSRYLKLAAGIVKEISDSRFQIPNSRFQIPDSKFRIRRPWSGIENLESRIVSEVYGLELKIWNLESLVKSMVWN
jgi:hypothetical protein